MKKRGMWAALFILAMLITACSPAAQAPEAAEKTTEAATEKAEKEVTEAVTEPVGESVQLTVSAAASLTDAMNESRQAFKEVLAICTAAQARMLCAASAWVEAAE